MHALNLPDVHALLHDIVIELIQEGGRGEFGTGEIRQRVCNQTINDDAHSQEDEKQEHSQRKVQHGIFHDEKKRQSEFVEVRLD